MIYIGNNEIPAIYLGNEEIPGIYIGEELIYPMTVTAWSVSPLTISAPWEETTEKIKIAAMDSWTISSSESWITFSQNSGDSGRTNVIATIAENVGLSRTATITVQDTATTTAFTISVSQAETPFEVTPASVDIPRTGSTGVTVEISSPASYTISFSDSSWISYGTTGTSGVAGITSIYLAAGEWSGDTERTINMVVDNGTTAITVPVTQKITLLHEPFLCNYNAKQYNTNTGTFPATEGQMIASGLTFQSPPVITADTANGYVKFNANANNRIAMRFVYSADNPFNRYNTETGRTLTVIYKCSSGFSQSLFANRGRQDGQSSGDKYNYMVRDNMFHTSVSNFLPFPPRTNPCTVYIRVNADGSCERKCIETGQIATSSTITYGDNPSSCAFFAGGDTSLGEYFAGDFYWIYISTDALTDAEIQQVIDYNEQI